MGNVCLSSFWVLSLHTLKKHFFSGVLFFFFHFIHLRNDLLPVISFRICAFNEFSDKCCQRIDFALCRPDIRCHGHTSRTWPHTWYIIFRHFQTPNMESMIAETAPYHILQWDTLHEKRQCFWEFDSSFDVFCRCRSPFVSVKFTCASSLRMTWGPGFRGSLSCVSACVAPLGAGLCERWPWLSSACGWDWPVFGALTAADFDRVWHVVSDALSFGVVASVRFLSHVSHDLLPSFPRTTPFPTLGQCSHFPSSMVQEAVS